MYNPKPIDTSKIELSDEIKETIEILTRNTHEVWSAQKIADGWIYGDIIDEKNKTHNAIKEYDKLSEAEKKYDKNTVTEAIKVLIQMGYKITRE